MSMSTLLRLCTTALAITPTHFGCQAEDLVPCAFAAPSDKVQAVPLPMPLRSVRKLPASFFKAQQTFAENGTTLWFAQSEDRGKGRLRLTAWDPEGRIVRDIAVPNLTHCPQPTGISATSTGVVAYGYSYDKKGSFAYAQFVDHQGVPGELRTYRGHVSIEAIAGSPDGGVAMLMTVSDQATIHGVPVSGPSVNGNDPPSVLMLRLAAAGNLEWLRILDDDHHLHKPRIVDARDGRLALFVRRPGGPSWRGGGIEIWSPEGKQTWVAEKLADVTGAAFDVRGVLWAIGTAPLTVPPRDLLPSVDVAQVLDSYAPNLDRQVICEGGWMHTPQLGVDDDGDVVLLAVVAVPCSFDGVYLDGNREGDTWALLQINRRRLRAFHTLKTARARLAVGSQGRVAIVSTGMRGPTLVDGRKVGNVGETLLVQFDR